MNREKRRKIFERLKAQDPQPSTELNYQNTYQLLVAVILSAQATDKGVNKATATLFKIVGTPEKMVELGESKLKRYIKTIGLYNSKARNIIKMSRILVENHSSRVPDDRGALEALPGVGRKTANVILNTAFGHPTIAVDTHIFRVSNRTGLAPGKTPLEVEKKLNKFVADEFKLNAHHWLILHGRYTCTARIPKCVQCAIIDLCEFRRKLL